MSKLVLQNIHIEYGSNAVVHDVNLTVEDGQIGCLLGPSGCGKTTLLRAIAGFEPVTRGAITLKDQVISAPDVHLPPEKRNIGMVFQDYALFPHLSIADNITFGIRKQSGKNKARRVAELLELVNLPGYEKRYPHELSGGQQQRVSIARAIITEPSIVLADEPTGNLDSRTGQEVMELLCEIFRERNTTFILSSHDPQMQCYADRTVYFSDGKIETENHHTGEENAQ